MKILDQYIGNGYQLINGDTCEVIRAIPDESVHFEVYSPPFSSLYTYSNSDRDLGNSKNDEEFFTHFHFITTELFRILKAGRIMAVHCMNLPTSKERDGFIGIKDFRGDLIREFQSVGFIYHAEVAIWKNPVTAMQRTKALGLLHKQIKKDSCMSRMGIPDYVIIMRKPGENLEPVTHTNPNDIVFTPFMGIGSEVYQAVLNGRRGVGIELKPTYYKCAVDNLQMADKTNKQMDLFSFIS